MSQLVSLRGLRPFCAQVSEIRGIPASAGAESLAENFFNLRKKPCLLFQPLLLFACFGALCDAPLMCVHLLHAPPKFDCSALDRRPGLSLLNRQGVPRNWTHRLPAVAAAHFLYRLDMTRDGF